MDILYMSLLKKLFSHEKIIILCLSVVIFTFIYILLDDEHFSGVNIIKETIKKEVIKKKVSKNISGETIEGFPTIFTQSSLSKKNDPVDVENKLKSATYNVEKDVEEETITPETIETSILQRVFDRFYFSIQNATLLGYGDIYPVTNVLKTIVIFQSLFTVTLIVY
jgi:hypothetical protein